MCGEDFAYTENKMDFYIAIWFPLLLCLKFCIIKIEKKKAPNLGSSGVLYNL